VEGLKLNGKHQTDDEDIKLRRGNIRTKTENSKSQLMIVRRMEVGRLPKEVL
jgi:hypothetical protein